MKLFEQATRRATLAGIRIIRIALPLVSDKSLALLFRSTERVIYVFAGDKELTASIAEVAEIFELGPPYSSTVRKIAASMESDADLAASVLACLRKVSPYGAE